MDVQTDGPMEFLPILQDFILIGTAAQKTSTGGRTYLKSKMYDEGTDNCYGPLRIFLISSHLPRCRTLMKILLRRNGLSPLMSF